MSLCNIRFRNFFSHVTTLCLRNKFPPSNCLWLCQTLTDFQNFYTAEKRMKFTTKLYDITHLTLGMLLHYLRKLEIPIFCKYSADMEENAHKLNMCIDFNSSTRVTVYAKCIYVLAEYVKYEVYEGMAIFFSLRGPPLPGRLSTVPVSRNFFNSLLTPRFVHLFSGNSSVNLFAVYPFTYKLFIKILYCPRCWIPCWLLTNTAVLSAVANFRCHKLIAKVNK